MNTCTNVTLTVIFLGNLFYILAQKTCLLFLPLFCYLQGLLGDLPFSSDVSVLIQQNISFLVFICKPFTPFWISVLHSTHTDHKLSSVWLNLFHKSIAMCACDGSVKSSWKSWSVRDFCVLRLRTDCEMNAWMYVTASRRQLSYRRSWPGELTIFASYSHQVFSRLFLSRMYCMQSDWLLACCCRPSGCDHVHYG